MDSPGHRLAPELGERRFERVLDGGVEIAEGADDQDSAVAEH
jgi:hypothetical protein